MDISNYTSTFVYRYFKYWEGLEFIYIYVGILHMYTKTKVFWCALKAWLSSAHQSSSLLKDPLRRRPDSTWPSSWRLELEMKKWASFFPQQNHQVIFGRRATLKKYGENLGATLLFVGRQNEARQRVDCIRLARLGRKRQVCPTQS